VDGCGSPIVRLLEVKPSDIGLSHSSNLYLDRCLNCNFFGTDVSHQYDAEGRAIWIEGDFSNGAECLDLLEDQCSPDSIGSVRWQPFAESEIHEESLVITAGSDPAGQRFVYLSKM